MPSTKKITNMPKTSEGMLNTKKLKLGLVVGVLGDIIQTSPKLDHIIQDDEPTNDADTDAK